MGHGIVYCGECGKLLREDDFAKGRAQTVELRPFCADCRPIAAGPPKISTSPLLKRPTSEIRKPPAHGRSSDARRWIVAGGAMAAVAALALLIVVLSGGNAPPDEMPAGTGESPRDREAERSRLRQTQTGLREAERRAENERRLNELLEEARILEAGDPGFARRAEVEDRLTLALEVAGSRREEVERARSEYQGRALAAARRRVGPFPLGSEGHVNHWLILGPFPNPSDQGLFRDYLGTEETHDPWKGVEAAGGLRGDRVRWEPHVATRGLVNLFKVPHLGLKDGQKDLVNYAACRLECPEPREVDIRLGTDDGFRLWVDGTVVATQHAHRGVKEDQDRVRVALKKGMHLLLLKVEQGAQGHGFVVRITTPEGRPPPGIRVWN